MGNQTISVAIHAGNEEFCIKEVLESVEHISDEIVFILDSKSHDNTEKIVNEFKKNYIRKTNKPFKLFKRVFDYANTKSELLKECECDWILFLDGDEILEEKNSIREVLDKAENMGSDAISLIGHHFIYSLGQEDATSNPHLWGARLVKNTKRLHFEGYVHALIKGFDKSATTDELVIWHMGYVKHLQKILKKHIEDTEKTEIHTPEFLKQWYYSHLFGKYPVREFSPSNLPKIILDKFKLNKDEFYFMNRGLEPKHTIMVKQWQEFFNPRNVLDLGCGLGPYLYVWNLMVPEIVEHIKGIELSQWAVDNTLVPQVVEQGDVTKLTIRDKYDLVTAIDLLEHLNYEEIDNVIISLKRIAKKVLISVPYFGTPNCDNDPTHIIKEDRAWWINKFIMRGFKQIPTPDYFSFNEQLLIFEVSND